MKYQDDILEIVFYARGGQGAKSAAEILAQSALNEKKHVQAFPSFGPERSGAPTKTYLRISDHEIRTHEPIVDPDIAVVLDETLLDSEPVTQGISENEAIVVNTGRSAQEIKEQLGFSGKVYPVDANGISMSIVGQPRPNTVILGKLIQVTEAARLESVTEEFRKIFEGKIGKEITDKNVQAIEKAYDTL